MSEVCVCGHDTLDHGPVGCSIDQVSGGRMFPCLCEIEGIDTSTDGAAGESRPSAPSDLTLVADVEAWRHRQSHVNFTDTWQLLDRLIKDWKRLREEETSRTTTAPST